MTGMMTAETGHETVAAVDEAGGPMVSVGETGFTVSDEVVVLAEAGGPRGESIGALRNHIIAQHMREGRRALTLCSPGPDVGCTSLAVNLAVALAQAGAKTLLIDADMRKPAVQRFLTPSREVAGLRQCLEDGVPFGEAIQQEVLANLSILYAGGRSTRPQELLALPRFKTLIDLCLREYDITIVDTPPTNSSADARQVATVLGYALIVVGRDKTFVADVKLLTEELTSDRARVIGTVLDQD